jgi:hypothetical protein
VTEQLLNGADVVTRVQQMCRKRMSEHMAAHRLSKAASSRRFLSSEARLSASARAAAARVLVLMSLPKLGEASSARRVESRSFA